jgi:hypothetical protein
MIGETMSVLYLFAISIVVAFCLTNCLHRSIISILRYKMGALFAGDFGTLSVFQTSPTLGGFATLYLLSDVHVLGTYRSCFLKLASKVSPLSLIC